MPVSCHSVFYRPGALLSPNQQHQSIVGWLISRNDSDIIVYAHTAAYTTKYVKLCYIQRLQSVQNAAARIIFNLRRCDHITDALISLHWLRVPERITFRVATLTYRALHGSAPPYLASSFTYVADMPHRRRLRSASTEQLDVPTCRRSTIGGRAFPVDGAKVWNSLPSDVTSASSLSVFKNRLKTYLFRRCYETV